MPEWEPNIPDGWNHNHRAFLQAFMSRGTLTFAEGRKIIAAILSADDDGARRVDPDTITQDKFRSYIAKTREAIAPLDYDIRNTYHQVDRTQVWALINAHSDPSTQLATSRTPDELSFIKRVLDAMFETYNTNRQEVMAVTAAQARKLARPPAPANNNAHQNGDADRDEATQQARGADRGLKHSDVERLLPSLVDEGWFEESDDGFYSLSPRSLMELKTWLVSAYNEPDVNPDVWQRIKFCEACKEIVTVGQRCPDRDCNARIHDICCEAYWRTRRGGERICPKCQTAWTGENFVGERAVTETAASHRRAGRKSGRRSSMNDLTVDGDGEDMNDGEEE